MNNKELFVFLLICCLIPVSLPKIVTLINNNSDKIEDYMVDPFISLIFLVPFIVILGITISKFLELTNYQEIKTYKGSELEEELYETIVVKSFCPNCHAPFEGLSKCAYCGYSFIKKVKK